jgi:hypothetical protein
MKLLGAAEAALAHRCGGAIRPIFEPAGSKVLTPSSSGAPMPQPQAQIAVRRTPRSRTGDCWRAFMPPITSNARITRRGEAREATTRVGPETLRRQSGRLTKLPLIVTVHP